jgi:hypothetical protein
MNQESRKSGETYLEARNPGIKETIFFAPLPGFLVSRFRFHLAIQNQKSV